MTGSETVRITRPDMELVVDVRPAVGEQSDQPAVVLLHGLVGHRGEWDDVLTRLDPELRVLIPDLRCHGDSQLGSATIDRSAFVGDIAAVIERLAPGRVVLVGQSIGGVLATLVAHAMPSAVGHLVLVEAGAEPITPEDRAGLARWFESWPERFADRLEAERFFGAEHRSTPAWIAGLERDEQGFVPRFNAGDLLRMVDELGRTSRLSELRELTIPVTLLHAGDRGFLTSSDLDEMRAAVPRLDVSEALDCGHDIHLDDPANVARIIEAAAGRLHGLAR